MRTFKHEKYLSMPKEGGEIMKIEDMGCVAPDDLLDDTTTLSNMKIEGARVMAYYFLCSLQTVKLRQLQKKV